jgi:uncharacterized membrane protein YadS
MNLLLNIASSSQFLLATTAKFEPALEYFSNALLRQAVGLLGWGIRLWEGFCHQFGCLFLVLQPDSSFGHKSPQITFLLS